MSTSRELSEILRTRPREDGGFSLLYYCPGCKHAHQIQVDAKSGPSWTWVGDPERPTFNPSVRVSHPGYTYVRDGKTITKPEVTTCHHWVRNGQIEFLADSSCHQLRGFHDMAVFPEGYAT